MLNDTMDFKKNQNESFVLQTEPVPAVPSPISVDPGDPLRHELQILLQEKYPDMCPADISDNAACIERLIYRQQAIKRSENCEVPSNLNDCLKRLTSSLIDRCKARSGSMPTRRKILKSKLGSERYRKTLALCREFYRLRYTQAKRMSCARCNEGACELNTFRTTRKVFTNPPLLYAIENMPLCDVSLTSSGEWDLWIKEIEDIVGTR